MGSHMTEQLSLSRFTFPALKVDSYPLDHQGSPTILYLFIYLLTYLFYLFKYLLFIYLLIYLSVLGLSCSIQDL